MTARFTRFWLIPDHPPTRPECFVIPSYALVNRACPTEPTRAQIELAALWWRRFPDAKLILSTGDNQRLGVTNASVMADYAASLGVPRANLIEEDRSLDTLQNLQYSRAMIDFEHLSQPTLVTLDLYTRRAVAIARKQGWRDFYWLSVFAHGQPAYGSKSIQTYSRLTILLYEILASAYGRIADWQ
jgi:uncharacterized SAM-binding protein YcdF (DUF218 family)